MNTFRDRSILRVKRGVVGSGDTASHVLGGLVQTIPQTFDISSSNIGEFVSRRNDLVYFNPAEAVGVGTTTNTAVSIGKSYTIGELSEVISCLLYTSDAATICSV